MSDPQVERDAFLDGLVFARDTLWLINESDMLNLLSNRMRTRYGIELHQLKSPVQGDNAN